MSELPLLVLVGNPNSGKTTLFNALTGLAARVANYPGITVEHREGKATLSSSDNQVAPLVVDVVDVPGTYSLLARSDDEAVAVRAVFAQIPELRRADVVVCVVDATQLERNLHLVTQLRELPLPLVIALTMTDTIHNDGRTIDVGALQARIGVPVIPAPAVRRGAEALKLTLSNVLAQRGHRLALNTVALPIPPDLVDLIDDAGRALGQKIGLDAPRALGLLVAQAVVADGGTTIPVFDGIDVSSLRRHPKIHAVAGDLVAARWHRASTWASGIVSDPPVEPPSMRLTRRVDAVALHVVAGPVLLVGIFLTLFQALFSWAEPLMNGISAAVTVIADRADDLLPASLPMLKSLFVEGVIAGVGNVLVFVPQIAILFFFLALLEDTGYLARAAFLLDRVMKGVGLHGRAFVPLLSGFACAVPAIMATRTIESPKDRLVTILVTPLVLELPPYRRPRATQLWKAVWSRVSAFLVEAGTVILAITIILWALLKFPVDDAVVAEANARKVALHAQYDPEGEQGAEALKKHIKAVDDEADMKLVERSAAGRIGHFVEPLITPLGFNWKIGIGILASFAAREVFVSTLGIVYGAGGLYAR